MPEVLETNQIARIDYGVSLADIEAKVTADLAIKIDGVKDKEGYKLADTRRKEYVRLRNSIDRKRKELNGLAREHIKRVDSVAEEYREIIGRGEQHVTGLVEQIDEIVEAAKQDALDAVYNARNSKLIAAGITLDRIVVESLTDDQIDQRIAETLELNRLRAAEAERLAAEKVEADRKSTEEKERLRIDAANLAAERRKFEQDQSWQKAENIRLTVERDQVAAKERAELNLQRDEQRAVQAKINAAIEQEKVVKATEERIELARQNAESIRPDLEKLRAYVLGVESVRLPECSVGGAERLQEVRCVIQQACQECRTIIGN